MVDQMRDDTHTPHGWRMWQDLLASLIGRNVWIDINDNIVCFRCKVISPEVQFVEVIEISRRIVAGAWIEDLTERTHYIAYRHIIRVITEEERRE